MNDSHHHRPLSNGSEKHHSLDASSHLVAFHQDLMQLHQSSMNVEHLIEVAMGILRSLCPNGWNGIIYRDFNKKKFSIYTHLQPTPIPIELKMRSPSEFGLIRYCLEHQKHIEISDFGASHELYRDFEKSLEMDVPRLISFPIVYEQCYYGCILSEVYVVESEVSSLMSLYLHHIGLAMHHIIQNQINNVFYRIAMERSLDIPFSTIIHQFIAMIEQLLDCEHGTIYFCNHYQNEIWYISQYEGYHDSFGQEVVGKVAHLVKPITENSCPPNGNVESVLCVPVIGMDLFYLY